MLITLIILVPFKEESVYDIPSENGGKTSKRNKSLEANSQQLARSDLFAGLVMMTL